MEVTPTKLVNTVTILSKRVMLVVPWQKSVHPITAFCISQLADKRRTASALCFGDAFVAHTRNTCADAFLESEMEWMLSIDDDMVVPFGDANWFNLTTGFGFPEQFARLNTIDRLLSHNKTLVGALYFGRNPGGPAVYGEGMLGGKEIEYARKAPINVLKPTRWVGTGCILVHRSVFEDIEKRFPRLARGPNKQGGQWFTSSEHNALDWIDKTRKMLSEGAMTGEKAMKAYEMMEAASNDARCSSTLGIGEDVQFCVRASQAGHQPYVDFGLVAGHIGHHVYGPKG